MNLSWDVDGIYITNSKGDYVKLLFSLPLPFWLYKASHFWKYLKHD